ncbi:hypothetical protein VF14_07150 [Nostoc linckia z18]|uniref:Uncharacterized protein n=2 Tax=Nostoc linckia TaxID=92942 RepID=A0A9Q5ZEK7_NOSLI|nr:hypothetical protein [Nostoc linckia]PHK42756.1 hypothetical protein VF12_01510 [Nostoc linckia z15]PHK47378.1 hypothetical protein VF13_05515 [Nostoc linckia z16]PHJ61980.1 hypothetical protein VF02_18380 [Nostoc linckia z1]PHJ66334.1 hypothetical protein VF05_19220 [Nostoc linckia z3]PHJ73103.1 hypothetical protein VF03_16995 [Nostoc linckia z2]
MKAQRVLEKEILELLNEDVYQVEYVITLIEMHCSAQSRKCHENGISGDKFQDFRYWSAYAQGIADLKIKQQNYIPSSTKE